jgi:tetratricopeptide (TPR) repeat protein
MPRDRIFGTAARSFSAMGVIMKKVMLGVLLLGLLGGGGYFAYRFRHEWTPQRYFESGKKYFDQKKYPEATIAFLNALRTAPRDRDSRYYLALSLLRQEDFKRGGRVLRSLVEIYPDDERVTWNWGGST